MTRRPMPSGLYERLITAGLEETLRELDETLEVERKPLDDEEVHLAVAQFFERLVAGALAEHRGPKCSSRAVALIQRIASAIGGGDAAASEIVPGEPLARLLSIHARGDVVRRPDLPLSRSDVLTGTRQDPSLASQLVKEIASADAVDMLVSFIRWSGLVLLLDGLRDLTRTPSPLGRPRLRVITTSYMGATDPRAVEELASLPNTDVRVSYDTARTRLHAKAYLIHRTTGFGSAYVGSANISQAALTEGLEWTNKISQYELPHLWDKLASTFEVYWRLYDFLPFRQEDAPRLREAVAREAGAGAYVTTPLYDLRPFPFQEEILEALATERRISGKRRQLVVAATGTGKTMIAAFDYHRWSTGREQPTLLFIAHRREILEQALRTFRDVLRDGNFGDLMTGSDRPGTLDHLFCTIQSFNSQRLFEQPDRWAYVVVDEFHHAEAPGYNRLLEALRPDVLLGLTATPERSDALDVFRWFDGHASAEIRLPDAIERRLLSPFHYFGVADTVDYADLTWQRGGYRIDELRQRLDGNAARAHLVLKKVRDRLLDPTRARGLGFCVSVEHARFMARFFSEHGVPAAMVCGESPDEERRSVQQRLRHREINFIFVADLYNEGVDIPEVDTVLLLRPTESLTIYLQQLGRGLRLSRDKEVLTVLDFIGSHRKEFRFDRRLRALLNVPVRRLDQEVESGFPHLPVGCSLQLERVARDRVLDNIRANLTVRRARILEELRECTRLLGRPPRIGEALDALDGELDDLLARGLWTDLLAEAARRPPEPSPDAVRLARGIRRLAHVDDPAQIDAWLLHLKRSSSVGSTDELLARRLTMLYISLWDEVGKSGTALEAERRFRSCPGAVDSLAAMLEERRSRLDHETPPWDPERGGPLALHATYTRDEILAGLGHWTYQRRPECREGTLEIPTRKLDVFFVTLQKSEEEYSPTTRYEDFAIDERTFHWQSRSTTSDTSPTGRRYIEHVARGYVPLLFVREKRYGSNGLSMPFTFLGALVYRSHAGSSPVSFTWDLEFPMPARVLRIAQRLVAA